MAMSAGWAAKPAAMKTSCSFIRGNEPLVGGARSKASVANRPSTPSSTTHRYPTNSASAESAGRRQRYA
jgi:hypothetical protein